MAESFSQDSFSQDFFSRQFSDDYKLAHPTLLPGLPLPAPLLEAEVVVAGRIWWPILLWPETKTLHTLVILEIERVVPVAFT